MRKSIILTATICSLFAVSCAKSGTETSNEANKRYMDAWILVNHPDWKPVGLGYYIDPTYEVEGTGESVKGYNYILLNYTVMDLEGNIGVSTFEDVNRRIGNHDDADAPYYGPVVVRMDTITTPAGVEDALMTMKVGGRRKVILPAWLNTTERFDTAEEYLEQSTGEGEAVYELEITEVTNDMVQYQINNIEKYIAKRYGMEKTDSLFRGYYKKVLREGRDTTSLPTDTVIYLNYTGRRLDGQVFDTTIGDTAKVNKIFSRDTEYEPVSFTVDEDYTKSTLGDDETNVIDGFSYGISTMKPMEKAVFIFISDYGYEADGNSTGIPGFAPLEFVIELVKKPE